MGKFHNCHVWGEGWGCLTKGQYTTLTTFALDSVETSPSELMPFAPINSSHCLHYSDVCVVMYHHHSPPANGHRAAERSLHCSADVWCSLCFELRRPLLPCWSTWLCGASTGCFKVFQASGRSRPLINAHKHPASKSVRSPLSIPEIPVSSTRLRNKFTKSARISYFAHAWDFL